MSITNPIQYVSRTFTTILNDINSDAELASKPNWWKRLWAGIGDVISIWINALANLLFLRTAFTRGAVRDLCELIDYTLSAQSTASGKLLFYVSTAVGGAIYPFTVSIANLSALSPGSVGVSAKQYMARSSETFASVTSTAVRSGNDLTVIVDLVYTGHKVRFTTAGTLPGGLSTGTDYYVIYGNATTIKVAATLADAFAGNYITLTSAGSGAHTLTLYSRAVTAYQETALSNAVAIGTSDGSTAWQEFQLADKYVLAATLVITINSVTWTAVDSFIDSTATSKHFKLIPLADNQFSVRFGDGTYGAIPGNFDVYAQYSYGGGSSSNITTLNRITAYNGADTNLTGATNATTFTGGADEESIESAKRLAPLLLKTRDRFVTDSDGQALVEAYGGIAFAKVTENYYGLLSARVLGIATGGGNPGSTVRTAIEAYLIERSVLSSIDVRFPACTITSKAVTASVKILSGYTWAGVSAYATAAFKLFFSEAGYELKTKYTEEGVAAAVTLYNTIFSAAFTSSDYAQFTKLFDGLSPRNFGDVIQESDALGYIDAFVTGLDYLTIAAPTFPIALVSDEITTIGSVSLTQIP